jgi:hypothetical protein
LRRPLPQSRARDWLLYPVGWHVRSDYGCRKLCPQEEKSCGQHSSMSYPIALETMQCPDPLLDIERGINGKGPTGRLTVRQELRAPLSPAWSEPEVSTIYE